MQKIQPADRSTLPRRPRRRALPGFALGLGLSLGLGMSATAADIDSEDFNAKFQSTWIWQRKEAFQSPYAGVNSLTAAREKSYSFTATAAFGLRLWQGAEFYLDPELAMGVPLSNLTGLGGMTNGEMARSSGANPTLYRARAFLRQTIGFGGGQTQLESAANQLAGAADKRRLVITAGNLAVSDLFDNNSYSHDPRKQFINWSIMSHGAYDFAADARGYSWGAALAYYHDDWAVRAGRFSVPVESNGMALNYRLGRYYGDQIELEHSHELLGQAGVLRVLGFRNVAVMGNYRDALALAAPSGAAPVLADVRRPQSKVGLGLSLEQAIDSSTGLFLRASRADGRTETYAFSEIDRSVSGGLLKQGAGWGRPDDSIGLAMVQNGLSRAHRDYLAAGGYGFFVGDGQLNYRPERIAEVFYSLALNKTMQATLNFQRIVNPAYNHDRGPVSLTALRLHADF